MKKFLALAVSAVMFCSLALFTACGEENIGKMSGNFKKEATAEEFAAAATQVQNAVEQDKILGGDTEAENWSFGFDSRAKFTVKTKLGEESSSVKLDAGYKLSLRNEKTEDKINLAVKGAGDVSVKASDDKSEDVSLAFYNDTDFVYIDATSVQAGMKIKMGIEDVMEILVGFVGSSSVSPVTMSVADNVETEEKVSGSVEIGEVFSSLVQAGCKIYIDDAKGLKIKISATAEALTTLLTGSASSAEISLPYEISSAAKCDLYFALDKEGKLAQISADVDISLSGASADGAEENAASISLKGGFYVKAYAGEVTFPEDLGSYSDGLFPGLFPGLTA